MHQESAHLHLSDSVKGNQTDVGIWEGVGACLHLTEDLRSVSASEHWQLPHGPVSVVLVSRGNWSHSLSVLGSGVGGGWLRELEAWGPSVVHDVRHLLGDVIISEWWEERESLEELQVRR